MDKNMENDMATRNIYLYIPIYVYICIGLEFFQEEAFKRHIGGSCRGI